MTSPEQPKKRPTGIIIAAVAVLLVAAVAITAAVVGGDRAGDRQTSLAAATPAAQPTAAADTVAPSPTGPAIHQLGEDVFNGVGGKVTAFAYKQPVAASAPRPQQDGFEWGAADVQVCATIDNVVVTHLPWHLVYADHTTIDASSVGYNQFPQPAYPWDERPVPNGQCVRGWITFPVPVGKRPVAVEDAAQDVVVEWAVS